MSRIENPISLMPSEVVIAADESIDPETSTTQHIELDDFVLPSGESTYKRTMFSC